MTAIAILSCLHEILSFFVDIYSFQDHSLDIKQAGLPEVGMLKSLELEDPIS